jgi:hypothetical protein
VNYTIRQFLHLKYEQWPSTGSLIKRLVLVCLLAILLPNRWPGTEHFDARDKLNAKYFFSKKKVNKQIISLFLGF